MWTEERLNDLLTTPSKALMDDLRALDGDIMVLGAGGKMGPTLCVLAARALQAAGSSKRVIAVSRFSDPEAIALLDRHGVQRISCDLLDRAQLAALPHAENILYMAGRKFGTGGNEWQTWAMNATLPAFVADTFRGGRIVVFSSGNIYPLVSLHTGGCTEETPVKPRGEYAMSCLARERAFEYAAQAHGTRVLLLRLNFAVDLRYGVLYDLAERMLQDEAISLSTPVYNCLWQGTANEYALRSLLHADAPARILNITGPETASVQSTAVKLGALLGKKPRFEGSPTDSAYLNDASEAIRLFGYPSVPLDMLIQWQAQWLLDGGRTLGKPTHFEERGGVY